MNSREQEDLGEMFAMQWYASQGAPVYYPLGHSPDVDSIAEVDARLLRIQVKTSTRYDKARWEVRICTRGGNQSWNGITKLMDASRCDFLFVVVADGRRWCIPSGALGGGTAILLGGPKYTEFEVDRGPPLVRSRGRTRVYNREPLFPRGDVRVVKGARL